MTFHVLQISTLIDVIINKKNHRIEKDEEKLEEIVELENIGEIRTSCLFKVY